MGNDVISKIVFSFSLIVFFILSGYTLNDNNLDKKYVNNKFKRLMIPYFVTCFCIMIMDIINTIILKHDYTIYNISSIMNNDLVRTFFASGSISKFLNINLSGSIGVIWFFPALFFSVLMSKAIIQKNKSYINMFGISLIIAIIGIISAKFIWLPFSIQSGMMACPFIVFGKYMKEKNILEKIKIKEIVICLIIFMLGYFLDKNQINFATAYIQDFIISPITCLAASIIVIKLSKLLEKSKVLIYIGRNSIYFLCTHSFLLATFGIYINKVFQLLRIDSNIYIIFLIHVIICLIISAIINIFTKLFSNKKEVDNSISNNNSRDLTIDVLRTICIIMMIFGHYSIDNGLRTIIFSFHMMAFVFLSGYLYKDKKDNIIKIICKEIKRLIIPVLLFSIGYILLKNYGFVTEMKDLLLGMSFSNKIFTKANSIGPFYFVLMLFVIKIIYILINKLVGENNKDLKINLLCIILSFAGAIVGENGFYLPWSIDVAIYSIIFYNLGYMFKKHELIKKLMDKKYLYFVISPIWVYMIYAGGMEIAIRKYEPYGLVVFGSLSGILIMYMFANSISSRIGKIGNKIMNLIGSSTIYILMVHTLLGNNIKNFFSLLGLEPKNIFNCIVAICTQILFGIIIFILIKSIKKILYKYLGQYRKIQI